jgi:hypothetical protein
MIQTGYQDYLREEVDDLFSKLFSRVKDMTKDIITDWLKNVHTQISSDPGLADAILMNVRIANCTKWVHNSAESYGNTLREGLDDLMKVR